MSRRIVEQDGAASRLRRVPFWSDLARALALLMIAAIFAFAVCVVIATMRGERAAAVSTDLSVDQH